VAPDAAAESGEGGSGGVVGKLTLTLTFTPESCHRKARVEINPIKSHFNWRFPEFLIYSRSILKMGS